jgi:hypothetical protein
VKEKNLDSSQTNSTVMPHLLENLSFISKLISGTLLPKALLSCEGFTPLVSYLFCVLYEIM